MDGDTFDGDVFDDAFDGDTSTFIVSFTGDVAGDAFDGDFFSFSSPIPVTESFCLGDEPLPLACGEPFAFAFAFGFGGDRFAFVSFNLFSSASISTLCELIAGRALFEDLSALFGHPVTLGLPKEAAADISALTIVSDEAVDVVDCVGAVEFSAMGIEATPDPLCPYDSSLC